MFEAKEALRLEVRERPDPFRKGHTDVQIRAKQIPQPIATLAVDFISRWGMVAGVVDGEDTAGRSKVRLATEQELVDRAVKTAELLFNTIVEKGWVLDVPVAKEPALPDKEA